MRELGSRVRVRIVEPLQQHSVRVTFENGDVREIDLEPYLQGPIFQPVRTNRIMFCAIKVEGGTLAWENGADIDPEVLYYNLLPAWMGLEQTGNQ